MTSIPLPQVLQEAYEGFKANHKTTDDVSHNVEFARYLDSEDPLKEYRTQFHFPKVASVLNANHGDNKEEAAAAKSCSRTEFLYLCGNSLGLQHVGVEGALQQELGKWRDQAVEGHFLQPNPWFEVDNVLRKDMAHVVGALESEVVLMNTLTCNLHLLLSAFYKPSGKRTKILSEAFPFPSDTHALVSQVERHGLSPEEHYITVFSEGADSTGKKDPTEQRPAVISTQTFLDAIERHGEEIAVVVVGAIHFLTGQLFDIAAIVKAAHAKGALVCVDAAHAVGNVPLYFHDWDVDFACWCTYKYLNGGPGNIGGAFVHDRHAPAAEKEPMGKEVSALKGWWGHARSNRFSLHRTFDNAGGAASFQLSNPCVVGMMSLAPSLRLFGTITMPVLRKKSLKLTGYLEYLIKARLAGKIEILSPADPEQRGAQLSVRILPGQLKSRQMAAAAYKCGNDLGNDADAAQKQLLYAGVMCDNRPPDILRLAPTPTYNSYTDVYELVETLVGLF